MKVAKFIISFFFTFILTLALSLQFGQVPPIGKFFDPFKGFMRNATGKELDFDPIENLPGLKNQVLIAHDSLLIPHIFAENDYDLYYAQGYITAVHRLWQMEFQTHAAAGRISELFGGDYLNYDRFQRRKGMVYGARNTLKEALKNDTLKNVLQAYTDGVNAYISTLSYPEFPVEYKLMNYSPEPWTPLKSALMFEMLQENLNGSDMDLENSNLLALLKKDRFDFLYPDRLPNSQPVIPTGTQWNFKPVPIDTPAITFRQEEMVSASDLPAPDPDNGSNNWVVAGSKTKSGNPILANDPHLNFNFPCIWFVNQLNAPEINVLGGSVPGIPGVFIGFNDSIAWGLTNAPRDARDWYQISFTDEDRSEYLYDDKRLKTQTVVEHFKIKGSADVADTIVLTHYGPVVYDRNFPTSENKKRLTNFALRWIGHDPSSSMLSSYKVNRAHNYNEFMEGLQYFDSPAQNVAFAAASGDIAMRVQGKFPAKWKGQGKFLMDGSNSDFDWQKIIPNNQNAQVLNPEKGFLSSANQIPVDSAYPYYVYDFNYEHFRYKRINQRLSELGNKITPQDMMTLQNDAYNLRAAESLPVMMDSLDFSALSAEESDAFDLLRKWNFNNDVNLAAPTLYETWWSNLYNLIWDEFADKSWPLYYPSVANTIYIMKNYPGDSCFDQTSTTAKEYLSDLLLASFKNTYKELEEWKTTRNEDYKWGSYRGVYIQHLARLKPFSRYDIAVNGGKNIVAANKENHGQSWKMVVALGDNVNAWGIYPGGQSGNPGSYYYDNMVDDWAKGVHYPLLFMKSRSGDRERLIFSQTLQPR